MAFPILGSVLPISIIVYIQAPDVSRVRTKTVFHVYGSSGTFKNTESLDDGRRHAVLRLVNLEVA